MSGNNKEMKAALAKIEEAKEIIDTEIAEHGWDIGVADDYEDKSPKQFPKVRLTRAARMVDSVLIKRVAKAYYGKNNPAYIPNEEELMIAKASVLMTFDGAQWDCNAVEGLGEGFFGAVWVKLAKYLV